MEHASVGVAQIIGGSGFIAAIQKDVADIHQRATEAIAAIRAVAHRVAQFMVVARRIDKDIFAVDLADGGGFKELVTVKASRVALALEGQHERGAFADGHHILFQLHDHAAGVLQIAEAAHEKRNFGLKT